MPKTDNLPKDYVRLRYVKSPTPKDIRLFLAYFPSYDNGYVWPVQCVETKNERSLLVKLDASELCGQSVKPEDMCYQQKLVLLDEENREAVIYDADFFKMKFQRPNEHLMKLDEEHEKGKETKRAKLKATLSETFGSSMSRKLVRNKNKNSENRAGIDSTIDFVETDDKVMNDVKEEDEALEEDMTSYFPPHNKEAARVKDAFPLDGIITGEELDALVNVSKDFIESSISSIKEWEKNKMYGTYVCSKLRRLPAEETARQHFSCILMYFHYLVILYSLKAHEFKKKDFLPKSVPPEVKNKLIDSFTVPLVGQKQGRSMPTKMKDILLFHILVLSLHIDEFDVQTSDLNEDLKGKDLMKYFRMIGCRVTKIVGDTYIKNNARAVLKVPLVFPELERRGRKRKGAFK